MSLTSLLSTLTLDGFPVSIGKGEKRLKSVHFDVGSFATPFWVRYDLSPLKVYRFDALPIDLPTIGTFLEVLSYDPTVNTGHTYYVSTTGSSSNSGSISSPWSLTYASGGAGGVIQPGDTIYIRGGTYTGTFLFTGPAGTKSARVVYRQYGGDAPLGERVTIDGGTEIKAPYTDLRGIEIFQSDPNTTFNLTGCILGNQTVDVTGSRLINCIIHDCGTTGTTHWLNAHGAMHYGVISYNNGTTHNLDHGYYCHDQQFSVMCCIAYNNLARNFQSYDSTRNQDQVIFRNNISFGASEISPLVDRGSNYTFRVINAVIQDNFSFEDCIGFHKPPDGGKAYQFRVGTLGNLSANKKMTVRRFFGQTGNVTAEINEYQNLIVEDVALSGSGPTQPVALLRALPTASVSWANNTWYRDPSANAWQYQSKKQTFASWQTNSGLGGSDTATSTTFVGRYYVFPNELSLAEGVGRGHLAIYNPEGLSSVTVNLSPVLRVGQSFKLQNVQDLWGTATVTGVWDGVGVSVPMTGVAPPTPIGPTRVYSTPPTTAPDFDCWLILQT